MKIIWCGRSQWNLRVGISHQFVGIWLIFPWWPLGLRWFWSPCWGWFRLRLRDGGHLCTGSFYFPSGHYINAEIRLEGVHSQEGGAGFLGSNWNNAKTNFIKTMWNGDNKCFFLFGLFSNISSQAKSIVIVVQSWFHDELEIVIRISVINFSERLDMCICIDVYSDFRLRKKFFVSLDFEIDVVYSSVYLDESVQTFMVTFHIFSIVVVIT